MAYIVIVIGVLLFSAVGGGWIGYLLTGLLFIAVAIFRDPELTASILHAATAKRRRKMLIEKSIERLTKQYPDVDWAAAWKNPEAPLKARMTEQTDQAKQGENGTDNATRNRQSK